MDGVRFDHVARSIGNRRGLLRVGAGGALAGWLRLLGPAGETRAKKKGKPKNKKPKKKKTSCDYTCTADFPVCCPGNDVQTGPICCSLVLPRCCPFGCCLDDPYMVCGTASNAPCVYL